MDKEPIKRTLEIMPLSQEHHYSLLFSWKVKKGVEKGIATDRILRYVKYFWENHLRQHFKQEQLVLFNTVTDNALVVKIIKKQEETATKIQSLLAETGSDEDLRATLLGLAEQIKNMVRAEERDVFPELEKVLSTEELGTITERIHQMQPEHLRDNYTDEFWSESK